MRTRYDTPETKKRILSTCVRLFIKQGYKNTPPRQIFVEADVSSGTFYHLFPTKSKILIELTSFMFTSQFEIAGQIAGKDATPAMLYAVETAIQLTLVELNENLREIYVEAYTNSELLGIIHEKMSEALVKIFTPYTPERSGKDFYELEIGTAGMMRGYMARPCDEDFTLEQKLQRFLGITLRIFCVPREEREHILETIGALDMRKVADEVMRTLFSALEMKYDFKLSK